MIKSIPFVQAQGKYRCLIFSIVSSFDFEFNKFRNVFLSKGFYKKKNRCQNVFTFFEYKGFRGNFERNYKDN